MTEEHWKKLNAQRALTEMKKNIERVRRAELERCLESWLPYLQRHEPMRPSESREIIQDRTFQQILETVGSAP